MKAIRGAGELNVFINCYQLQRIENAAEGEADESPVFLCGMFMKFVPGGGASNSVDADEDGAVQRDAFIAPRNDVTRLLKTNDQLEWRDEDVMYDMVDKQIIQPGYYRITVEKHTARQ